MRLLTVLSLLGLLAGAGPSLAQSLQQQMDLDQRAAALQAQQDMLARQAVIQQNRLDVLEAQIRTEQAISQIQAQSRTPQIPPAPVGGATRTIDASGLASIPDDRLAASNARVRAASEPRR